MLPFTSLALPPPLARAIEVLGFTAMTPVQEHALPPLLAGKDVIAQARTGSGKTAAFGLSLLARVELASAKIQALVLVPTRELADQVSAEIRRLGRFLPNLRVVTLTGGVPVRTQKPSLEHSPHVVVATPGRMIDHLERGHVSLAGLGVLVLDEADRMLDMGFVGAIEEIVAQTPKARQTLLFSATFPGEIRTLSKQLQRTPVEVTVDAEQAEIEEIFHEVTAEQKLDALSALLLSHRPEACLVFCHTRNDVRDVSAALDGRGFSVLALHGEMEQRERDEVLVRFANRSAQVLVATDVAARGLDIKGLPLVVAWELPIDADVHTHRVGRTGRAGEKGLAVALVGPRERGRADALTGRARWEKLDLAAARGTPQPPPMVTLVIDGGKKDKLRPGDLLGALTGDVGLPAEAIGKIDIQALRAFVAVKRERAGEALERLKQGKIKGRTFRVSRR